MSVLSALATDRLPAAKPDECDVQREPSLALLPDGRLLTMFRVDARSMLFQAFSADLGRSKPHDYCWGSGLHSSQECQQ